jgi:hypothetical protein
VHARPLEKSRRNTRTRNLSPPKTKWCVERTHRLLSHAHGLRRLWCKGAMMGWLCCSGLSEGAQVWTGSPPSYRLSDRWSVRLKVILSIACGHSAVLFQCSSVLEWRIQLIADCPLVNAARPLGLLLQWYYCVQGGTLHVESFCGGMDAVAPVWTRSASFPDSNIN